MAEKNKRKVKMSGDRLAMLRKGNKVAGKSKSDYSARVEQNKGVKDGTIRLGKNGKSYNIWDAKSGRWVKGEVKAEGPTQGSTEDSKKKAALEAAKKQNDARKDAMSKEGREKTEKKYSSYQTGSQGGKTYDRAMREAKGKLNTPGERAMDSVGNKLRSITDPANRRGRDAQVKANNKRVGAERRAREKRRQEALLAAIKMKRGG